MTSIASSEKSKPESVNPNPAMAARELTLIVAATSKMGIGRNGVLPWTGLKKEMAYFARVTKRSVNSEDTNTVLMGRKTWESIPKRFQPLEDRHNVVVSRQAVSSEGSEIGAAGGSDGPAKWATSITDAIEASRGAHGRIFVIGGAQIYEAALARDEARRILLTRVLSDFECDTFFPIDLKVDGKADEWEKKSKAELDQWIGEIAPEDVQEENGTKYIFEMWERI